MKRRKVLVLATFALFCTILGGLGLYQTLFSLPLFLIVAEEHPSVGSDDAPVEVVVFEDFLCPTCCQFTLEVFPSIQSSYIDQGTVKYILIPLAFSGASEEVANAVLTVFSQAPQYSFRFIQQLFLRYSNQKYLIWPDLFDLASQIDGIDLTDFTESVQTGRFNEQLAHNLQIAKKMMRKDFHMPAVFVNGRRVLEASFEALSVRLQLVLKEMP